MWTPLQLPQAFVKIIVSQSFRPENEMKWIFGWAFSLNLLARRQETLVSSSQCLLCRILSQIFLIFFVFVFVFVFTVLGYSGISNGPALAKLPTCQHNESSPLQSSHGHWNMMIIYKIFLKSFFAFLDALASLRPIFKIDWFGHVFEIASIEFSLVPDCFNNKKSTLSTMSAL